MHAAPVVGAGHAAAHFERARRDSLVLHPPQSVEPARNVLINVTCNFASTLVANHSKFPNRCLGTTAHLCEPDSQPRASARPINPDAPPRESSASRDSCSACRSAGPARRLRAACGGPPVQRSPFRCGLTHRRAGDRTRSFHHRVPVRAPPAGTPCRAEVSGCMPDCGIISAGYNI